jgi:heme-degrading monooxygenase HmoA
MKEPMIGRTWRGATRAIDAEAYVHYLRETGLREYRETPGNRGVLGLRRTLGDRAEFLLLSLWENQEAVRRFAGDDVRRAVFYPEDDRFLVDREEQAAHYAVVHHDGLPADVTSSRAERAPREAEMRSTKPLTSIAPEIFRKRLLIEGFFAREMNREALVEFFEHVTRELGLRTYAEPIIHRTSGQGKEGNEGFDAFVPLIDSGIYVAAWVAPRFMTTVIYTCATFDDERAVTLVRDFFRLQEHQAAIF